MENLQVKLEPEEVENEICSIIKIEQEEIIFKQVNLCSVIKIEEEEIVAENLGEEIELKEIEVQLRNVRPKISEVNRKFESFFVEVETENLKISKPLRGKNLFRKKPRGENSLKNVRVVLHDIRKFSGVKEKFNSFFLEINTRNLKIPKPIKTIKFNEEKTKDIKRKKIKRDKFFSSSSKLGDHLLEHGDFQCKICHKIFRVKKRFDNHECPFCRICNKSFTELAYFRTHNEIYHNKNRIKLKCDLCGKLLATKITLLLHFRGVHSIAGNQEIVNCDICGTEFADLTLLRYHMGNHQKVECKICKRKITKIALNSHLNQYHAKKGSVKCMKCPKTFKSKEALQYHKNLIHDKKFQCKICSKNFGNQRILKEHLYVHANSESFKCKICDKNFSTSSYLKDHIKRIHESKNQEKRFKCEKCEYSTNKNSHFKRHQNVHKNYEAKLKSRKNWIRCEKCPALLGCSTSYGHHMAQVHGNIKFSCDFCGKSCSNKSNLKAHILCTHIKTCKYRDLLIEK